MTARSLLKHGLTAVIAICLLPLGLLGQGVTTSAMNGYIVGPDGSPIAGSTVTALHNPTGTTYTATTNESGRYDIRGMRPGGPYTLNVFTSGFLTERREGIQLTLQRALTVDLVLRSEGSLTNEDIIELEEFVISAADQDLTFNPNKMGADTAIDAEAIEYLPTVTRSITDFVRLDPRIAVFDRESGAISAGGKSTRYNTLIIDGVPTNDSFGLNPNGSPSLRQPFSIDTLEQISVETSPYSVTRAGFTGASITAITKSGTNEFGGSVYATYRDESMVGDLQDTTGRPIVIGDFEEYTVGFTFGGPIIKDTLFFFLNYEKVEESQLNDQPLFFPTEDSLNALEQVASLAQYDIGTLDAPGSIKSQDDKYKLKLDWNINQSHRFTVAYDLVVGSEPRFPSFLGGTTTSFSSHWHQIQHENAKYSTQLYSTWSDWLSTEIRVSYNEYTRDFDNNSRLPEIQISQVEGTSLDPTVNNPVSGTVWLGTNSNTQNNELMVNTLVAEMLGRIYVGDHTFTVGAYLERVENSNTFIRDRFGSWFFRDDVGDWLDSLSSTREADRYTLTLPAPGQTGGAEFAITTLALYLQDEWAVGDRLNLLAGIRMDVPFVDQAPPAARASPDGRTFEEVFGGVNTHTIDGNLVIAPRVGFNLALDEDRNLQLRGGAGLFYGTAPHVWLASSYTNNGVSQEQYFVSAQSTGDSPIFSADVDNPPLPPRTDARVAVDYIDEDLKMPTDWKANLALDYRLPWWDIKTTLEAQASWVKDDIHFIHQNLAQTSNPNSTGFLPDGRMLFDNEIARQREDGYSDVIKMVNTDQGRAYSYTFEIGRDRGEEGFSWKLGYTYTDSKSVNDNLGTSAFANWSSNVAYNPNDQLLTTSTYETRHRYIATASYQLTYLKRHRTTFTVFYEHFSGRPFSYLYGAERFSTDINRDGLTGNDLLYVPTGLDDPLVAFNRQEAGEAFMAFVDATPGLRDFKGQVVPRNTGRAPWVTQIDISVSHEIDLWYDHQLELQVSILNFMNMIDSDRGRILRPVANRGAGVVVTDARHNPRANFRNGNENGFYTYVVNTDNFLTRNMFETTDFDSRWSILLSVKYKF